MYEITTHDGRTYQIAQQDEKRIAQLAKRLELVPVMLTNGKVEYFSKGTVARLSKRWNKPEYSMPALSDGQPKNKRAAPDSEAFQAFKRKRDELLSKKV